MKAINQNLESAKLTKKTITKTTTVTTISKTNNGKCGKKYGKCLHGECYCKYNYLGILIKNSKKSFGCQSRYSKCW